MYDYKKTVETLINKGIAEGEIIGANVLLIKDGEEKLFASYGKACKETGEDMKRDTIFRMFSMTKPVTAVAAMILFERGLIDLRDAVSKYLPAYKDQIVWTKDGLVPAVRDITIQDCLNMTTGVTYPSMDHEPGRQMGVLFQELIRRRVDGEVVDTLEYMDRIAKIPLVFQPGDHWLYGLSADILGAVIQVVSGKTYGQFLKDEIFDPLGMVDTGFYVPAEKLHRFAAAYEWDEEKQMLKRREGSYLGEYYEEDVAFESGGAGLVSTIDDYAKFACMLMQKGKLGDVRILGEKTVEFMTENRLDEIQMKDYNWDSTIGYGYSCLMRILQDKGIAGSNGSVGEFGWDGWTGNYVTMNPADNMVLLFFIQRCGYGFGALTRKVRAVTYGALQDL